MAKSVKSDAKGAPEISERLVKGTIKSVLAAYEDIESARGSYMNKARRIRETMATAYESAAAAGIPQKVMKLQIKILMQLEKLQGLFTELEAEEQAELRKIAKLAGNATQLKMFAELPVLKAPKAKIIPDDKPAAKAKNGSGKKGGGATGADIEQAEVAAGNAPIAEPTEFKPLH